MIGGGGCWGTSVRATVMDSLMLVAIGLLAASNLAVSMFLMVVWEVSRSLKLANWVCPGSTLTVLLMVAAAVLGPRLSVS